MVNKRRDGKSWLATLARALLTGVLCLCALVPGAFADTPFRLQRQVLATPRAVAPEGYIGDPCFSPDGRRLLYLRFGVDEGKGDLYVADAQGRSPVRVARRVFEACWSPDACRIACLIGEYADANTPLDLWTLQPDGTGARCCAKAVAYTGNSPCAWSPRGDRLAYLSSGGHSLWLVDPDGANPRRLLASTWLDALTWTADGRICVWDHVGTSRGTVAKRFSQSWIVDPESGSVTPIKAPVAGAYAGPCAFSPDGRYQALVAYGPHIHVQPSGDGGVWRTPAVTTWIRKTSGGRWQRLFSRMGQRAEISWSPHGNRLVTNLITFADCAVDGEFAVWDAAGRRLSPWAPGCDVHWSPGGTRLSYSVYTEGHGGRLMICDATGRHRTAVGEFSDVPGGLGWAPDERTLAMVSYPRWQRPRLEIIRVRP